MNTQPAEERIVETLRRFAQAYQAKNLEEMLQTLSPEAQVISSDGQVYCGKEAIRQRLLMEFQQTTAERIVPSWMEIQTTPGSAQCHSEYLLLERRHDTTRSSARGSFDAKLVPCGTRWEIARAAFRLHSQHGV